MWTTPFLSISTFFWLRFGRFCVSDACFGSAAFQVLCVVAGLLPWVTWVWRAAGDACVSRRGGKHDVVERGKPYR